MEVLILSSSLREDAGEHEQKDKVATSLYSHIHIYTCASSNSKMYQALL